MKIVAVTACPTGVAHTYLAAEALEKAARQLGHQIKVETQGSIGIENGIKKKDIENADVAILTNDMAIKNRERFNGLTIVEVGIGDAIKKAPAILKKVEEDMQK